MIWYCVYRDRYKDHEVKIIVDRRHSMGGSDVRGEIENFSDVDSAP